MSLRSCVKLSKAASMALVSVFWSTTMKFFCESGGAVTCYDHIVCQTGAPICLFAVVGAAIATYAYAREEEAGHRVLELVGRQRYCRSFLSSAPDLSARFPRTSSPMTARNCRSL